MILLKSFVFRGEQYNGGLIGGIIYILRMKFKRDKEKAKETVEILKTPLDKSDELRDKYLNEEGKE